MRSNFILGKDLCMSVKKKGQECPSMKITCMNVKCVYQIFQIRCRSSMDAFCNDFSLNY